MFIIIARKKAITQVLGYIVMESGIYTFGVAMVINESFTVKICVLQDIFVAVLIMGWIQFYQWIFISWNARLNPWLF